MYKYICGGNPQVIYIMGPCWMDETSAWIYTELCTLLACILGGYSCVVWRYRLHIAICLCSLNVHKRRGWWCKETQHSTTQHNRAPYTNNILNCDVKLCVQPLAGKKMRRNNKNNKKSSCDNHSAVLYFCALCNTRQHIYTVFFGWKCTSVCLHERQRNCIHKCI